MIVSAIVPVHVSRNHKNIKKASVLTRFLQSLGPWHFDRIFVRNLFRLKKKANCTANKDDERKETLPVEEYLNTISPYLNGIINNL